MRNKFLKRAHVSARQFKQLLRLFCQDLTAIQIANLSGMSRVTVNKYLRVFRQRMAFLCEEQSPVSGEVEVDESWFGARRRNGKRGRGAAGKTIVFGIYKRNGKVYTQIVGNCSRSTLQHIIFGHVEKDSIIHSDKWKAYDGLVDFGYKKHYRVDHGNDEFVKGTSHINGIEGFWGLAKTRLMKFKGIHRSTFYLHLKECEFRFNYRKENIYNLLLQSFKNCPLNLS